MMLRDIFAKNISRPIETVIKADDQDHVYQEVEEYVLTREVCNRIRDFFSAYNDYQGANGVWISGFFGSGKSHLLKILSYVMSNREYEGKNLGELFAEKIGDDAMLEADVINATRIPSESILFNIDQQAQITSKQDSDAILGVFYKVLDDHLGFFGAQRHVAEFERWLTSEKVYEKFREQFEQESGKPWPDERRKYFSPKVKEAIHTVLTKLMGETPEGYRNVIDDLRKDNAISIEDFCTKVNDYINTQPKGFRLNFFVDEVGQYISDNNKLMLNLQTIAETLATHTKGQSWVLVTSQEDIEKVLGDLNKSQQNDFSRIQARFKIKIPLTSANVDEVIEKRLLEKTEAAEKVLAEIWKKEHSNLDTLLTFSEIGVQFKRFREEHDFVNKYPFVPYQFDLFQQCIRALSTHNAFQGKHASVGERSMLGVFQDVGIAMGTKEEGALVTFDLLYEGIRSTIRGEIQQSIILAEKQLDDTFAIQILKALFLVKYYSNFKTTARNVSVLMINDIHIDLKEHDQRVQKALNLLEAQTYVQRNGEVYEFLTDDEKDIEQEIKGTDIEESAVTQLMNQLLFDEIIRESKIKFVENKQDYEFSQKVDGSMSGREKELTIDIITPNHEDYENQDLLRAQTSGFSTLMMMVLPPHERVLKDVRLYLKTEKFIKQNQTTANKETVKRILYEKGTQNGERRRALITLLSKQLGESTVLLNGSQHEVSSTEGKTKVVNAFQDLVKLAYPSLKMLNSKIYSEETVRNIIRSRQDDLFNNDDNTISEAEKEILNFVNRRRKGSDRTTLSDIRDKFTKKPYGWYPNAIWSLVGMLYKRGKLEVRQNSNLLEDEEVLSALTNNREHSNTLLEPQVDIDPRQVQTLKKIYRDLFDQSCPATEGKDVAQAFRDRLKEELATVKEFTNQQRQYPFTQSLLPMQEQLEKLSHKELNYFLLSHQEFEDSLLDAKEDVLTPIKQFWNGDQRKIYDQMKLFLERDQPNFDYIDEEEIQQLRGIYEQPKPYAGNHIQNAKLMMQAIQGKVQSKIEEERASAIEKAELEKKTLKANADYQSLESSQQQTILKPIDDQIKKITSNPYIPTIRQMASEVAEIKVQQLNNIQQVKPATPGSSVGPKIQYINKGNVVVRFPKDILETEQDVEEYVAQLKEEYLRHIREHRRISL